MLVIIIPGIGKASVAVNVDRWSQADEIVRKRLILLNECESYVLLFSKFIVLIYFYYIYTNLSMHISILFAYN